jgi:hypothetical protein
MVRSPLPNLASVSRFDQFLRRALTEITGEEISVHTVSENRDLISCISQKLARETGLDSCDIARWISVSLKQYWTETELHP